MHADAEVNLDVHVQKASSCDTCNPTTDFAQNQDELISFTP